MDSTNPIQIYQTEDGQTQIDVRFEQDTVWLSQAQMVELFGRDQSVVSRHIRNAVNDGEVAEKSNMQKMHMTDEFSNEQVRHTEDVDLIVHTLGYVGFNALQEQLKGHGFKIPVPDPGEALPICAMKLGDLRVDFMLTTIRWDLPISGIKRQCKQRQNMH